MPLPAKVAKALHFCRAYGVKLETVQLGYGQFAASARAPLVQTSHAMALSNVELVADVTDELDPLAADDAANCVVMAELLRNAATFDFLDGVMEVVAQSALAAARPNARDMVARALEGVLAGQGKTGFMQSIVESDRGLLSGEVWFKLQDIILATGLVRIGGDNVGTAFLVGPDLALTCHHVACDEAGLKAGIELWFHARERPFEAQFVTSRAITLEYSSKPYGDYPHTPWELTAEADDKLDYALIRLDRRLGDRPPIELAANGYTAVNGRHTFLFGFPGDKAIKGDVATGITAREPGSRLLHGLNAVPGMSGSPLLGHLGTATGLHEAGFDVKSATAAGNDAKGWTSGSNRAIDLGKVLAHLKKNKGMQPPFPPLRASDDLAIHSAAVRKTWARQGINVAMAIGSDDASRAALAAEWSDLVTRLGDPPPSSREDPTELLHPIFRREAVTSWLVNAIRPASLERVLIVASAESGRARGHSFLGEVSATRLVEPRRSLLRLHWQSTASGSWREDSTLRSSAATRPEAGLVSLDEANALVLEHDRRMESAGEDPPVAIVDLGGLTEIEASVCEEWEALTLRLVRAGYKVILIDLPWSRLDGMTSAFEKDEIWADAGYRVIDMAYVAWPDVDAWLRQFEGRDRRFKDQKLEDPWPKPERNRLRKKWEDPGQLHNRHVEFTSLMAVWFALARDLLRDRS